MEAQRFQRVGGLLAVLACGAVFCAGLHPGWAEPAAHPESVKPTAGGKLAVLIPCTGMIDDGLYQSIRRRTDEALAQGASYLVYEIQTYGGLVKSADDISKYFILEAAKKARTIAYVTTEAISAGAMISVSCQDIVMKENTKIGDCAPILMGEQLEGVEREKAESFIRAIFSTAAEANGYPEPLLLAMVTQTLEVWRVKNAETGLWEFFEKDYLPTDATKYDLENQELIVKNSQILTLTASKAKEYGIAREVVNDYEGALAYLANRDGVTFSPQRTVLQTNWSEEMVRWLGSPVVVSVLVMIALLGFYVEIRTPGLGLPGAIGAAALILLVSSKYLIGLANWVEIAVFLLGLVLLMIEIFLIPGFGVTGALGIICIMVGLFGMLIRNAPDEVPWPQNPAAWDLLVDGLTGFTGGFVGFLILAFLLIRYMPQSRLFAGLTLTESLKGETMAVSMTSSPDSRIAPLNVGDTGRAITRLRPAGEADFDGRVVDVVSQGEFIEAGKSVRILEIRGNRVVVRELT
ncbi:MAG: hypothetical protein JW828_00470 [Sedimentisphaerales bacterium]|nr:hypothetical protein [Sedimentisphaerales bacterium]